MEEEKKPRGRPKITNSLAAQEIEKAEEQFDAYDKSIKELTLDRMNMAKKEDVEQQTKLSSREIEKADEIYLKPVRRISSREKFNEDYREKYEFAKEYVRIIAENKEVIGETIDLWTKPFAGLPAEEWHVPVNKPIWVPRYVAEQIKRCSYHRLKSEESTITSTDGLGKYHGSIVVDTTVQRLDAIPANNKRKSIFMGAF